MLTRHSIRRVLTRHPVLRLIMLATLSVLVGVVVVRAFGAGELLVGIAMAGRGLVPPDEPPRTPAAARRQARDETTELTRVTVFAETLAVGQARCALAAARQGRGMVDDVEAALARLAARGALTGEVRSELVQLTQSHLTRLHALTEAFQSCLGRLAASYGLRPLPQLWLQLAARAQRRWQQRIPVE